MVYRYTIDNIISLLQTVGTLSKEQIMRFFSGELADYRVEYLLNQLAIKHILIYDEQEDFTRPWIEGSDFRDKIRFHIGDALRLIPEMDLRDIDLAFIDADKRHYVDFYEMLLPRMRTGGFILADNTLWYGHVTEEHPRVSDLQTQGIKRFNDLVARDERVEKVIVPVRDGLTIVRIRD